MLNTTSTFPSELGISTRIGLTRGVGGIASFAEAETRYREELLEARRARRASRTARSFTGRTRRWTGVTRWTPWHSSDPRRPSSPAATNSNACAN